MKLEEYLKLDGVGIAELVNSGQVTKTQVLACAKEARAKVDGKIHGFTRDTDEVSDRQAATPAKGPLAGVPFPIKDLYNRIEGVIFSDGSRINPKVPSAANSTLVQRYIDSGATLFGITNSPEFGLTVTTEPVAWKEPTRNPWNTDHSAGGSSGGAGAVVAAGITPVANATDGGGSIRIPAQCNGLVGLKPSRGRTPMGPEVLEGWQGQSIGHVVSRTVRDTAAFLDATHGDTIGSPYSVPAAPAEGYLANSKQAVGKLKIAFSSKALVPVQDDVKAALADAVELLSGLGHSLKEDTADINYTDAAKALMSIISSNLHHDISAKEEEYGITVDNSHIEKVTLNLRERGRELTSADLVSAIRMNHRIGQIWGQFHQNYDIFLCPTLAKVSLPIGQIDMNTDDMLSYGAELGAYTPFAGQFNQSGQPSISLPLGLSSGGLPIGIMATAAYGREDLLLRLANQIEQHTVWNKGQRAKVWAGA